MTDGFKSSRIVALLAAAALGLAGCKGDAGPAGAAGAAGISGADGAPGAPGDTGAQGGTGQAGSTGLPGATGAMGASGANGVNNPATVALTVQFNNVNGTALTPDSKGNYPAASGVYCFTNPDFTGNTADQVLDGTADGSGAITIEAPPGSYTFQCRGGADYADPAQFTLSAYAGATTTQTVYVTRTNPLYFTAASATTAIPGAAVTVTATAAGGTGTTNITYSGSGLTAIDASSGTFTVPELDQVLASLDAGNGVWKAFKLPKGPGLVALGDGAIKSLAKAYKVKVTATDSATPTPRVATTTVTIPVATLNTRADDATAKFGLSAIQGLSTMPLGIVAVANDVVGVPYGWTVSSAPSGSVVTTASLKGASTRNPYFIPDKEGQYVLQNGTTTVTLTAAKYVGINAAAPYGCKNCHADNVTTWGTVSLHGNHNARVPSATAMTILQWGLTGVDYSTTCYKCHTDGAFPASLDNGGFYTTMTIADAGQAGADNTKWKGDGLDHWTGLPQNLKDLAGIQCESCHGPGSQHQGYPTKISKPYGSMACAPCHDSPPHHDKVDLWAQSGHANGDLAVEEGTNDSSGCSRCHSVQGFIQWANANLVDANGVSLGTVTSGATAADVQPQTCQACHDPHSTNLRIDGSSPVVLPAGFTVEGAGAGSLCMACHNSRRGLHGDDAAGPGGKAPHTPTQTDVLMGMNAYFVPNYYYVSDHAAIAETCVGCHVKLHPATTVVANTNHTFMADTSICVSCHTNVNGEAIAGAFKAAQTDVLNAMNTAIVNAVTPSGGGTPNYTIVAQDPNGNKRAVALTQAPISLALTTSHGSPLLALTFATAVDDPFNSGSTTTTLSTAMTDIKVNGTAVITANGRFGKAVWNYFLVDDKSNGIHNKTFVFEVLMQTTLALGNVSLGAL